MAVTGRGTESEPFVVHDYWELKSICNHSDNWGDVYVNLDADIDCNDYGDSFEWETIYVGYKGSTLSSPERFCRLDLCGHTIKNILIKRNNKLFERSNYMKENETYVKNGKILNIFNNGIESLIAEHGDDKSMYFENISFSINCSGITSHITEYTNMKKCAIYLSGNITVNNYMFKNNFEDCDIFIAGYFPSGTTEICSGKMKNCRIRGTTVFVNKLLNASVLTGCVVDIPFIAPYSTWKFWADGSTGVVNDSKSYSGTDMIPCSGKYNPNGLIVATDAQLHSASELSKLGFNVVKVGE